MNLESLSTLFCWNCGTTWNQKGHVVILSPCRCGAGSFASIELIDEVQHTHYMHLSRNYVLLSNDCVYFSKIKVVWMVFER